MIKEILNIIPQLDRKSLARMTRDLTKRFATVAQRFGKGLEKVMKGNLLFLSMGLLTQLLNPLEKVEERIKSLLGQGGDLRDMAERFNTTPAMLKRMESVAQVQGLDPSEFRDMLTRYADAIDAARKELADPTKERSAATLAVQDFVDEADQAQGFMQFMKRLAEVESGPGQDVFFGEREQRLAAEREASGRELTDIERRRLEAEGLMGRQSGRDLRDEIETAIFGAKQYGAQRRFLGADMAAESARLGVPMLGGAGGSEGNLDPLNATLHNLAGLDDILRAKQVANDLTDTIASAALVQEKAVNSIEAARVRQMDRDRSQLTNIESLQKANEGIDEIKRLMNDLSKHAVEAVGYLGTLIPKIEEFARTVGDWWSKSEAIQGTLNTMSEYLGRIANSRMARGIRSYFSGD